MRLLAYLIAGIAFATAAGAAEPVTAIVHATVIHPERDNDVAVPDSTIVVRGNRIESVGRSATRSIGGSPP